MLCVYGQSDPGAQPKEARAWRRAGANSAGELIQPSTTSPLTPHPKPDSGIFSQPKERTPVLITSQNSAQTPGVMGLCGGQPDLPPVLDAFLGRRRFPPACSNWNIF